MPWRRFCARCSPKLPVSHLSPFIALFSLASPLTSAATPSSGRGKGNAPLRLIKATAAAALVMATAAASCDGRIQPSNNCTDDLECSANERCSEQGQCVEQSTTEPEGGPAAEPSVAEPSAEPEGQPEGAEPESDAGVLEPEPAPEPDDAVACQDLAEDNADAWGVEHPFEDLEAFIDTNPNVGNSAIAVRTSLTQPARLVYPKQRDRSIDATAYKSLVFSLRGTSSTAVFAPPVVVLEDCDGATQRLVSTRPLASGDPWKRFAVPLGESNAAWTTTGTIDFSRLRGVFIEVNAQGGYDLSVDDVGFVAVDGGSCPATCPDCAGRGVCEVRQGLPGCACECMDLSEDNSPEWGSYFSPDHPAAVTTTVVADSENVLVGNSSIAATTDASFDWAVVYPGNQSVIWDLTQTEAISFWSRGENANVPDWQGAFPAVVIRDAFEQQMTLTPAENRLSEEWTHHLVPLAGGNGWTKTGDVTMSNVVQIEFHADTWENSFSFWVDGVAFRQAGNVCLETCLSTCAVGTCQLLRGMPTCL